MEATMMPPLQQDAKEHMKTDMPWIIGSQMGDLLQDEECALDDEAVPSNEKTYAMTVADAKVAWTHSDYTYEKRSAITKEV
jgi:hypothetical protein